METYRKKIKTQNWLFLAAIAALIAVQALSLLEIIKPVSVSGNLADFWNGFIGGAALGVTAIFIVGLILNIRALRSESALKRQMIKETDERSIAIHAKGKAMGSTIFLICGIPAAIICGYFSFTIFVTVAACVLALGTTIAFCKLYYSKKL